MATLTYMPKEIQAGDTLVFTKSLGDYPASNGWTLTYYLSSADNFYSFSASAVENDFSIEVAATSTGLWVAGDYKYLARVVLAGAVYVVATGMVTILADFTAAADLRSHSKIMIDAIEEVLEGRIPDDVERYSIAGRTIDMIPIPELMQLQSHYKMQYKKELSAQRQAAGKTGNPQILVRF